MKRLNTIKAICSHLDHAFGPFRHRRRAPLDALIATILSQNTSDTNSSRAFESLKAAFPTWAAAHAASRRKIQHAIASGGLAPTKSRYIKGILATLAEKTGKPSLDNLRQMETEQARQFLLDLPGVGLKTASCVLLFSLHRPVCPVDTHVFRVSCRLGLIENAASADAATRILEKLLPDDCMLTFHLGLIHVGRTLCRPRKMLHDGCPLQQFCDTAKL